MKVFTWFHYVFIRHYADFKGRASRREYWWYVLAVSLLSMAGGLAALVTDYMFFDGQSLYLMKLIWCLVFITPGCAVTARRLHDTGRSGWWGLLSLLPIIGNTILLGYMFEKTQPGTNDFGPEPLYDNIPGKKNIKKGGIV